MKNTVLVLLLTFFSSLGFAKQLELPLEPGQCISLSEARLALKTYLTPYLGSVLDKDFRWADEVLDIETLNTGLNSVRWNSRFWFFESNAVTNGYCAAGAECWGYYVISCKGEVISREAGED